MKVFLETYGCTMNQADSDLIRGILSKKYQLADSVEDADVVVVNTCGVIEFTERKILRRMEELKRAGKTVVAAGCLTRIARDKVSKICDALVSPDNIHLIGEAVEKALNGEKVEILSPNRIDKACLHRLKKRLNENAIAIVSISEGCLGRCSYCATKIARGSLRSFSIDSIVEEVKDVVERGYKEIQLTSQDTGAYGLDKGYTLVDLLERICKIEGEFRVRVGMMNPQHVVNILDDLINAFSNEKIYKFIHVPVQSGDNKVLKDMRRDYTVEDFIEIVRSFRRNFDDVMVSTDIIVGFPTESEESFWKSYELVREVKPDIVNITRFSPRRGTLAAKMRDIPDWIKKERSRKLTKLSKEIGFENNAKFVGREERVLITRKGKGDTLLSRTDSYRPVIIDHGRIGEFTNVRICGATFNYLKGIVA